MSAITWFIVSRRRWVLAVFLLFSALTVLGAPMVGAAQVELERSNPQPSSVHAESPTAIRLWFSDAIDARASEVRVLDVDGNTVSGLAAEPGADDRSLVVPIPAPLDNGAYTVAWNAASAADGQESAGYLTFTIGSQIDIASSSVPMVGQPTGAPLWLQAAARWLALLTLAIAVAVWPIWLLVLWPAARNAVQTGALGQRARAIGLGAIVAALLANVLALVVEATTRIGGSLVTRTGDTLFDSRYGQLWLARVGVLLVLALGLRYAPWRNPLGKRPLSTVLLIVSLLAPVPYALDSHTSLLDSGRWTAVFFDYAHLISASLWFGGLALLAGVLLRALPDQHDRRVVLAQALPRFSATALVCWGLLAVSGVYAWWLQGGSRDVLRETPYGQAMLLKLALIALVLLIALLNLLLVTRHLTRAGAESQSAWFGRLGYAVLAELVLTTLILLAAGRMTSLPPGREVLATERYGQTVHFELDDRAVTLQFVPGAAGPNHFLVTVPGDAVPFGAQAFLGFTYLDQDIGSANVELGRSALTTFETHGSQFGVAGNWEVGLTVRLPDGVEWTDTQSLAIDTTGSPIPKEPWRLGTGGAVGLLLIGIAFTGFAIAWRAGKSRLRMESAGLGVAAALLGLMLMTQARTQPGSSYYFGLENPVAASSDSITRGSALFAANCLACHGASGQGDGPLSAGMYPPPANFLAPHTRLHTDGQFFDWIRNGKPNTSMPAFTTLTDEEIWHLINYIEVEFQGDPLEEGTPQPAE